MSRSLRFPRARWLVHTLIVGTVFVMACGWVGGSPPTPTITAPAAAPASSPSPDSKPAAPAPAPPSPSPSPSPSPAAEGDSYTVAEGDTLATIAEKFYGDPALWRRIYDANRGTIGDNPDNVRVGTSLRIPPKP
jgi:nucleoid-associated protein YgaU